jgi:S1-C subfamily serine protease
MVEVLRRFRSLARWLCAATAVSALAACGGSHVKTVTVSGSRGGGASSSSAGAVAALEQSFVNVIKRVSPDVVQISTPNGLGSGVVFDTSGDVVTNAHVVAGGGPYTVTDSHGRRLHATLVGTFTPDDLAVVHASGSSLPAATFADSRSLKVGEMVLAIGNPLGLRSSVTNGIVSAVGRTVSEPNNAVLPNVIQTSAAINPGNSGGALVDLEGKVVGIPTLAATDPQLGGAAPGIGFAIPSSLVTNIAGQIVKNGHVVNSHRAYLGVELATGVSNGAVVAAVQKGGPAAHAGIQAGELITSLAGHSISGPGEVTDLLAQLRPGQTIRVGLVKPDGSKATVKVKLGQYPGSLG